MAGAGEPDADCDYRDAAERAGDSRGVRGAGQARPVEGRAAGIERRLPQRLRPAAGGAPVRPEEQRGPERPGAQQLRPPAGADRVKPALRYVILRHEGVDDPHFDLMFETGPGSELATWRSPSWPPEQGSPLSKLPDHRRQYLTFEGKLSGERGQVHQVESGTCEVNYPGETAWQ